MTEPAKESLGDIEMGFTQEQATAMIGEFDALYAHSNVMGKKRVKVLWVFRDSLQAMLAHEGAAT